MAQLSYRANLSAKSWPFISDFFGRSVIVGSVSHDQNFNRQVQSSEDPDKDVGIPQVYYMHNVMPTSQGFQSIGFSPVIAAKAEGFTRIWNLHFATGSVYLATLQDGRNYVLIYGGAPNWVQINTIAGVAGRAVSVVNISGNSYVYFSGLGCYQYNPTLNVLAPVVLTGLTPAAILGIVSAVGYMIAYSSDTVAWSSTIDPTDFIPSNVTGAGSGGVERAKGPITLCVSDSFGFTVHTQYNAVAAIYSNNPRFPFNFREIKSAGGITSDEAVAFDVTDSVHYAYTTSGLQSISASNTQLILPEVTDFLSGKYFEDFDETTKTFTRTQVVRLKKAINLIGSRYLVMSYGINSYTHALVYDLTTKRWSKLKIPHVDCFEFLLYPAEMTEIARQSIGFLASDGAIFTVNLDANDTDIPHNGVLILGKYQYVRSRTLCLERVEIENVRTGTTFSLHDMVSIDGKNISSIVPGHLRENSGGLVDYDFHTVGMNHSLLLMGSFYAQTLQLTFVPGGDR